MLIVRHKVPIGNVFVFYVVVFVPGRIHVCLQVGDAALSAAVARLNRINASNRNQTREATPRGSLSPECIQIYPKETSPLFCPHVFLAESPTSLAVELMVAGNSLGIFQYRGIPGNSAPVAVRESRNMMVLKCLATNDVRINIAATAARGRANACAVEIVAFDAFRDRLWTGNGPRGTAAQFGRIPRSAWARGAPGQE